MTMQADDLFGGTTIFDELAKAAVRTYTADDLIGGGSWRNCPKLEVEQVQEFNGAPDKDGLLADEDEDGSVKDHNDA